MNRRSFASLIAALASPASVHAQPAWPDRPIRFILSQPPGSGPDNVARLLAERVAAAVGQAIVVDNKPGGQNVVGAQAAARAPADGYNFYFATTAALVTNRFLFKALPYDPVKDFEPVAFVARSPFVVLVSSQSPVASLPDLVARSKAAQGKLSLANEGPRTFGGIIARLLNARSGMQANLVSYASVGVSIQDVIGGHADAVVADLASTAQVVRQGRLRLLAVTSAQRLSGWESVPTVAETYAGFELSGWFALVAPSGTPAQVIVRMNREINVVLGDVEAARRMLAIGPIAESAGGPQRLAAFLGHEQERWAVVAREIGLLPE